MNETARATLDHLLIGVPTLEEGIAWLEEKTGVRAAMGGAHPGLGTWNALASLGPRQYIELIAPDPNQEATETFYVPDLRSLKAARVSGWAAIGRDLSKRFGPGLPSLLTCEPPRPGSRSRPDGSLLAWTLAFPRALDHGTFDGTLPFFIEWADESPHPGSAAPSGLTLAGFSIHHPEPEALSEALAALGLDVGVQRRPTPSFHVELDTPRGRVVL